MATARLAFSTPRTPQSPLLPPHAYSRCLTHDTRVKRDGTAACYTPSNQRERKCGQELVVVRTLQIPDHEGQSRLNLSHERQPPMLGSDVSRNARQRMAVSLRRS